MGGLCLLVVVLGVVAFSATTETVPDSGGTYVEGLVGQPRSLNPLLLQPDDPGQDIGALVFSGLTRSGEGGRIASDLARRWEMSPDGLTYTFYLRPDAKWQDGEPFSADDVVFTISLLQDLAFPGPPEVAALWREVRVEKLDSHTVRFTLKAPYAPFLEYTSLAMLPRHLLARVSANRLASDPFNQRPIGTGPYRVIGFDQSGVVLRASNVYYGHQPYLERLVFRFFPDTASALEALRKEAIQGLGVVAAAEVSALQGRGKHALYSAPELSRLTLLILDDKYPPLSQSQVRKAISLALDRDRLIEVGLGGQGQPAFGPIIPSSWAFKPDLVRYEHDVDRAKALLESAGWHDADGDGVREKEGQRLHLILLTNDNPERIRVADEIRRELSGVGIEVELQGASWLDLVRKFLAPHNFQMVLAEQSFPNMDPDVYSFWHSSQISEGLNFGAWSSRKADDLLERGRQISDQSQREKLYDEFQKVFAEEEPSVLLYYPVYTYAVGKEVRGVRLDTLLTPADRFRYVDQWYVKTRLVFRFPGQGEQAGRSP